LYFTLPNDERFPTQFEQRRVVLLIPAHISFEFRKPIIQPGFWHVRVDALSVLVPEATTHFDDFLQAWKNEIRLAGKFG
jgi:hypothetical protein